MDTLAVLFWSVGVPWSIVFSTFLLLLRIGKKKPRQEHTTARKEKDEVDRELEQDSFEGSQFEIGSGSEFFPEEPSENENNS